MRHAHRIATCLVAAVCLAVAPLAAKVTEKIDRTFKLAETGELVVSNVNGSIEVNASDGDQVILHAVKSANDADALQATTIEIDESPGRLEISTKHARSGWFGSNGNGTVTYNLTVPRGVHVKATSVNGTLTIREIQGDIEAETVNGAVKISDAGGAVAAKTVNGSLRADITTTPNMKSNSFKTVNGSVQVSLPSDVAGKFQAETVNGSINTDFVLEVHKPGPWGKKSINAQLGTGGASYSFSTVNGSIKITKN